MSELYVFVDNSNLWIQGKRVAGAQEGIPSNALYRIDYGKLLDVVRDSRDLGDVPKLYGSEPPPNDSVWKAIEGYGFDVNVFKRNIYNREKGVDMRMGLDVGKRLHQVGEPGVIAIVAGDGDFLPVIEDVREAGWEAEVWFWSRAAKSLQDGADRFESLDPHVYTFGFDKGDARK